MGLRDTLKSILTFLTLFFWVLPIRRETDSKRSTDIKFSYGMLVLAVVLYFFYSEPYVGPKEFPELSKLPVVEGVLIRHPTRRSGRYSSEPVGIRTAKGNVFKECTTMGLHCFAGPDQETKDWQTYFGQPARMWYWNEWVVQLEINGRIPEKLSYERMRNRHTSWLESFWMIILVGSYLVFRLIQRYGRTAFNECISYKPHN